MTNTFSNRTLDLLAQIIDRFFTHTEMTSLFFGVSVPDNFDHGSNKLDRSTRVVKELSRSKAPGHSDILRSLVEQTILRKPLVFSGRREHGAGPHPSAVEFFRALRSDGFEFADDRLVRADHLESDLATETSLLNRRLSARGMADVVRLLDQAHQNFIDGNWEACNAMLRSSLEGTLSHIAKAVAGGSPIPATNPAHGPAPADIRKFLKNAGFLENDEYEYIRVFYGYASTDGSHPGLSDESESRLRRLMVVALVQYCMEKLETKCP